LYKKNYALCGNCLNLEFGLIQPLRRLNIFLSVLPSGKGGRGASAAIAEPPAQSKKEAYGSDFNCACLQ
jgi:hypothetical protein